MSNSPSIPAPIDDSLPHECQHGLSVTFSSAHIPFILVDLFITCEPFFSAPRRPHGFCVALFLLSGAHLQLSRFSTCSMPSQCHLSNLISQPVHHHSNKLSAICIININTTGNQILCRLRLIYIHKTVTCQRLGLHANFKHFCNILKR